MNTGVQKEIGLDSENFSDREQLSDDYNDMKVPILDLNIESSVKSEGIEMEEIPQRAKNEQWMNMNSTSRLIEEMMLEEMDIQNEQYTLKKIKLPIQVKIDESSTQAIPFLPDPQLLLQDIPERLQCLYGSYPDKVSQEELEAEAKWIASKLKKKKKLGSNFDLDSLVFQVVLVLDLIKNQHFEVMYIHTYQFNEISDLKLEDLWFIQSRDLDWIKMSQKKVSLVKQIEERLLDEAPQSYVRNLILKSFDEYVLDACQDYIDYKEFTLDPLNSNFQLPTTFGINLSKLYADQGSNGSISNLLSEIFLTADDFAFNLKHGELLRTPKSIPQTITEFFEIKKDEYSYFQPNHVQFFESVILLMAYELYYHPWVKAFARRIYLDKVKISTQPKSKSTELEVENIDIYNPDYCVKKIRNRPFTQFKADETGIYLLKDQSEEKIDVRFHTSEEAVNIFELQSLGPEKDGMLKQLIDCFAMQDDDNLYCSSWNIIRRECIIYLAHHLLYPHLQNRLEKDILETSEKSVINSCAEQFRYIVNNGPCLSPEKETNYARVLSIVLTSDNQVLAVAIDENGVYQSKTNPLSKKPFQMMANQQAIDSVSTPKKEEYVILANFIAQNQPDLVVIGDQRISRRIIRKIVRDNEDRIPERLAKHIIYSSVEIPKLVLEASKEFIWNQNTLNDIDQEQQVAINLGRMQQDALCEVAKLWNDKTEENLLSKIIFHPLQTYVNQSRLMEKYMEVIIEIVNRTGVNLNQILLNKHRSSSLQFVCGLGPARAQHFLAKTLEKGVQEIKQRNDLLRFETSCFQDKIYLNAIGFINVSSLKHELSPSEFNKYDQTRIHPSWYSLARKIEEKAIEKDFGALNVVTNPSYCLYLFSEIDIRNLVSQIEQSQETKNMRPVLEFIINELINPFKSAQRTFSEWNQEFLFFRMTGLSIFECQVGALVQGVVIGITPAFLNLRLASGIETTVYKANVFDKYDPSALDKEFYEGQKIIGRIINIKYENYKSDFSSLVRITLSLNSEILNNHKPYIKVMHPNIDEDDSIDLTSDFPVVLTNKRKPKTFHQRNVMHNKFKNISAEEANNLLEDKEIGEFVFRPGKIMNQIYITWKIYDKVYSHVEVQESERCAGETIGRLLKIKKHTYSSLNEIIAKYLQPCIKHAKTVIEHPKFFHGDTRSILHQLQAENLTEPTLMPYHLLFSKDAPQYALLCYLKNNALETEYIKINSDGYSFLSTKFIILDEIIRYFKMNHNTAEYNHLKKKKAYIELVPDDDMPLTLSPTYSAFEIDTIKWRGIERLTLEQCDKVPDQDSLRVKQQRKPLRTCDNCGVKGHQSHQCPITGIPKKYRRNLSTKNPDNDNQQVKQRSNGCFKCGGEGHVAKECPNSGEKARKMICYRCGEEGHGTRNCTQPAKPVKSCFKCGEQGHIFKECTNPGQYPRKFICYKCGKEGHGAKNCLTPNTDKKFKSREQNNNGCRSRSRSQEKDQSRLTWSKAGWGSNQGDNGSDWGNWKNDKYANVQGGGWGVKAGSSDQMEVEPRKEDEWWGNDSDSLGVSMQKPLDKFSTKSMESWGDNKTDLRKDQFNPDSSW